MIVRRANIFTGRVRELDMMDPAESFEPITEWSYED